MAGGQPRSRTRLQYEHACRERYRANLKLAEAAIAAGAARASLPEAQQRALVRRANERGRDVTRAADRKEDRHSLKRAEAAGVADDDLTPAQRQAKRRKEGDKTKRQENKRLNLEAEKAIAAGRPLTAEQRKGYESLENSRKGNRDRNRKRRTDEAKAKKAKQKEAKASDDDDCSTWPDIVLFIL